MSRPRLADRRTVVIISVLPRNTRSDRRNGQQNNPHERPGTALHGHMTANGEPPVQERQAMTDAAGTRLRARQMKG